MKGRNRAKKGEGEAKNMSVREWMRESEGESEGESKECKRERERDRKRNCRLRLDTSMMSMSITSMLANPESAYIYIYICVCVCVCVCVNICVNVQPFSTIAVCPYALYRVQVTVYIKFFVNALLLRIRPIYTSIHWRQSILYQVLQELTP